MISNDLLKYFVELQKFDTLSATAEHLHISQSALSRAMQKIEQLVGLELFSRKKNSIALNDNGKLFAELTKNVLTQLQDSVEKVREFDRKNRTIFVGCCAPVPMNKVIFLLAQNFPDASISSELNSDEQLLTGLQKDLFNLVIVHETPQSEEFFFMKCGSEKLFLAVPLNHDFAKKEAIFLEDLNGEKVLLYSKIGFWYDLCKAKAPNAKFLIQQERDVFKELAEAAPFLSFTTDFLIEASLAQKNCLYKPILNPEAFVNYYCVCKIGQRIRFESLWKELSNDNLASKQIIYSF